MATENLVKRSIWVDEKIWDDLRAHYSQHGPGVSTVVRALMAAHHRKLLESNKLTPAVEIDSLLTNPPSTE